MYKKSSIIFGSLLFSSQIFAANLYVSTSGNGINCDAANPCATIQSAINAAEAGDTIHIAAGEYTENVTIPPGKNGLTVSGTGEGQTYVISAGGDDGKEAPPGVAVDIVFDIFSADVTIEKLTMEHPATVATKRDMAVFVRPPASNVTIQKTAIIRNRVGDNLEPTAPGSRGVFVLRATGTTISKNTFDGNYEDHIHIPSSETTISKNTVLNATRIGIVIIQENATSLSTDNIITKNIVENSGTDGIQIQGDNNLVAKNDVSNSGAAGIKLCGAGNCVAPGVNAVAEGNTLVENNLDNNAGGDIIDDGLNNN